MTGKKRGHKQHIPVAVTALRERPAELWRPLGGGRVGCGLCFRRCQIEPGAVGWCGYRRNVNGKMTIPEHGILGQLSRTQLGYSGGVDSFMPGALALGVGGIRCTSRCQFCLSTDLVWRPERLVWADRPERGQSGDQIWIGYRRRTTPREVIDTALAGEAQYVVFAGNEPTCSYEFTFDTARMAKSRGIGTIIATNGFTEPEPIRKLAPLVDVAYVGIKGALAPRFYAERMKAPGGPEAVKRALLEWKAAGVHLVLSHLIAPSHMLEDKEHDEAESTLYPWIVDNLGPDTPLCLNTMIRPVKGNPLFVTGPREEEKYLQRGARSSRRAISAGLHYTSTSGDTAEFYCRKCYGYLLKVVEVKHEPPCDPCTKDSTYCPFKRHYQGVTPDGRCVHCGAQTPLRVLSEHQLRRNHQVIERMQLAAQQ